MQDTVIRRTTCRLCESRSLDRGLSLAPTPLADSYIPSSRLSEPQETFPLDLYLCRECGFTQILDVVQPQVIYFDYLYETKTSLGLVEHFGGYAKDVLARVAPRPGSLVVDIGSNDGTLLRFFKQGGMKVLGVDPARAIAKAATEAGIETWAELFNQALAERIRAERGPASVITVNNLFANVDDLANMTRGIRTLLADDGVFVFESFYLADLMRNMVFDFIYHEHISYFSVKPLQSFFARHGLELIDAQPVRTKGGSLRYTIQLAGGPRKPSPVVASMIAAEEKAGICKLETLRAFSGRVDDSKNALTSLMRKLKAEGKMFAGYGASATSTTMIYHYGIGDMLDFIVDDNPQRQQLFSPGLHIPILSGTALDERKPDYLVVLAWRYVEPIKLKVDAYLKKGGRLIVPLPEVKVL